jgi:hypothetical protein
MAVWKLRTHLIYLLVVLLWERSQLFAHGAYCGGERLNYRRYVSWAWRGWRRRRGELWSQGCTPLATSNHRDKCGTLAAILWMSSAIPSTKWFLQPCWYFLLEMHRRRRGFNAPVIRIFSSNVQAVQTGIQKIDFRDEFCDLWWVRISLREPSYLSLMFVGLLSPCIRIRGY